MKSVIKSWRNLKKNVHYNKAIYGNLRNHTHTHTETDRHTHTHTQRQTDTHTHTHIHTHTTENKRTTKKLP